MTVPAPSQLDLRQEVHDAARRARVAARRLASLPTTVKDRALHAAADELLAHRDQILAANAEDLNAAREADTPAAMLDRLSLNPQRVDGIAAGLRQVADCAIRSVKCCVAIPCPTGCSCASSASPWAWSA